MNRRLWIALSLLFALSVVHGHDAQRNITPEDLWKVKRLGVPSTSPDGQWAVVDVGIVDVARNETNSELWLLSTDGKTQKQLTRSGGRNSSPKWSPDGKSIAFLSMRPGDETTQIYTIAPEGGEAKRISKMPMTPFGIKWSADSKTIFCTAWTWNDTPTDADYLKRTRELKENKVQAYIIEEGTFRYWDRWIADGKRPVVWAVDVTSGSHRNLLQHCKRYLPPYEASEKDYDVTPEGTTLAFVSENVKVLGLDTNHDIYTLDLTKPDAEPVNITRDNEANDTNPVYSPDGKNLAFLRQTTKFFYADRYRLMLRDVANGTNKELSANLDRSCGNPVWLPDSKRIAVEVEDSGITNIAFATLDGKITRPKEPVSERGISFAMGVKNPIPVNASLHEQMRHESEAIVNRLDANKTSPSLELEALKSEIMKQEENLKELDDQIAVVMHRVKAKHKSSADANQNRDYASLEELSSTRIKQMKAKLDKQVKYATLLSQVAKQQARVGVYQISSFNQPSAIVAHRPGAAAIRIEHFNDDLVKQWKLGKVENTTFKGADDRDVQMFIVYPPNFDETKKWPLLQMVHGGPHNAMTNDFSFRWHPHVWAAQGWVVAIVNFHGSSGFGQQFTDSITGDMGTKPMIDIMKSTELLCSKPWIDKNRVAAAGASYGGYMMAWLNGHTDVFKTMVCHAGVYNWHSMTASDLVRGRERSLGAPPWGDLSKIDAQNAQRFAANFKTPTLVIHGEKDFRVPITQGIEYYNTLRQKGVPTRFLYFPDENHWVLKPQNALLWHKEVFAWLSKYIGNGPTK